MKNDCEIRDLSKYLSIKVFIQGTLMQLLRKHIQFSLNKKNLSRSLQEILVVNPIVTK